MLVTLVEKIKKHLSPGVSALLYFIGNLLNRIPGPVLLAACVAVTVMNSAALVSNDVVVSRKSNNRFLRFLRGHDAGFAMAYIGQATTTIIVLAMATFLVNIPTYVIAGVLFSTIGVCVSVGMEMVCSVMDADDFKDQESSTDAQFRRRMFLHGAFGGAVAVCIIMMPICFRGLTPVD